MQYVANLTAAGVDAGSWAHSCEQAGWDGVSVADHCVHHSRLWPHVFVAASAAAVATDRIFVTTSFANNLFRHPVEFAQAAMALQVASKGRFEAGLGAGWSADELAMMGVRFPSPGERVERYVEAIIICRALFETGRCTFDGRWYQVDIEGFRVEGVEGVAGPPLVGSLSGPRILREAGPMLDRIEVSAGSATRGGTLDYAKIGQLTIDDVRRQIDQAKAANPDAAVSFSVVCSVGSGADAGAADFPSDSIYKPFFGEAAKVVDAIESLADLGIDRATVTPPSADQLDAIIAARSDASPGFGLVARV